MPEYDGIWFSPPAPLARVTLRSAITGAVWDNVPMLIDTGADVTLVPQATISHLNLTVNYQRLFGLEAFDGTTSISPVIQLELLWLGRTYRGEFLVVDQEWGILRRNITNTVPLVLDGPRHVWNELRQS